MRNQSHSEDFPVGGRKAGVGFLSAMMECTALRSQFEVAGLHPDRQARGYIPVVHVSRTVRLSTSGATGRCSKSTTRGTSRCHHRSRRPEARREAIQKTCPRLPARPWRKE